MNDKSGLKNHYYTTKVNSESKKYNKDYKNKKKFYDLTQLEENVDILALNKLINKLNIKNNSKNNSIYKYNKTNYIKENIVNKNKKLQNILPYVNKGNNTNNYLSHKILKINPEEKVILSKSEKVQKIKDKLSKKNDFLLTQILIKKHKMENEEKRKNIKNLKIKIFKIMNKKGLICHNFLKKNDNFNLRFINYLNSKNFIKSKKEFSDNFHFSKNDLNQAHDPYKQYLNEYSLSKNSINYKDVLNSLNNKEKKIIEKEPNYFFRNNKVFEEFVDLEKKSLTTTLREEEDIQNMIINKIPKKEIEEYKEKNDIINQRIKFLNQRKKNEIKSDDIPNLINDDTIKIIKNQIDLRLKTKKKYKKNLINDEIKNCEKILELKNLNIYEENKNFNNTFNKKINYFSKNDILNKNSKRLDREEMHQMKRKINNSKVQGEKYINDLKNIIMNIYNFNNQKQNEEDK